MNWRLRHGERVDIGSHPNRSLRYEEKWEADFRPRPAPSDDNPSDDHLVTLILVTETSVAVLI